MAAYRADIQIGVSGQRELERLRSAITQTSEAAESLNRIRVNGGRLAQSLENYNTQLERAQRNLQIVATASQAENKAITEYVTALGSANAARARQNDLIEDEIRLQQTAARVARLAAAGIRETSGTTQLGPGPASPVGSLVGQKSPVAERINQTLQARKDEIQLQAALLRLEEKSATAANKELQARGEIARLAARGVNAAAFRAAQTGTPVALPAFQERGLRLLDDSVRLNESNRRIEQALNGERQRGVRFLEKQTAEERRQVELGILGSRTGALSGSARATGAVPAGGFPVSGPLQSPGFRKTQQGVGKFGENLALGAGFPLLFGGGPGAVAGSVLGSFVGSGFGGQILGGGIGKILDQAIQKTAQLGTALQTLDLSKVEESGVRINSNLETQISLLRQTGNAYAAQELLLQQVYATTGALPGTVEGISTSVNVLSSAWSEFTAAAGVTLGIVGAPFAAALGAILSAVNNIVKGFNVAASALGALIQKTGEWVVALIGGEDALRSIQDYFSSLNAATDEARAKYAPILSDLNSQVLLNRELLNLEKQKTTGADAGGKDRNIELSAQQKILSINADIDNQIRETNKDITEATKAQVIEAVRLLNVKRNQKIEEVQIETIIQRQRAAEVARDKAAREAERAAKEAARAAEQAARAAEQRANALAQFEKDYYTDQLKILALNVQQVEILNGGQAALQRQFELSETNAKIRTRILTIERELAVREAAKTGTTAEIIQLYEQRFKLLQDELNVEYEITRQKEAQAKLDSFTAAQQALQAAVSPFQDFRFNQEQEAQGVKTYLRLVQEGILPAEAERRINFEKLVSSQLRSLDIQIATQQSILDQAVAYGLVGEKVEELRRNLKNLKEAREGVTGQAVQGPGTGATDRERLEGALAGAKGQLNELTDPINQIVAGANAIGTAFQQAFSGLVSGAMTGQQALAAFFQGVGDHFMDMASKMIAKLIEIWILETVLGFIGSVAGGAAGGSFSGGTSSAVPTDLGGWTQGFSTPLKFAEGGFVTGPTSAIIGEGGESEYVIPASKMQSAMARYSRGARGEAVIPATGGSEGGDTPAAGGPMAIDVRYSVERINDVEYVTASQFQAGLRLAAQQGASQGEQRALRQLQQNTSIRGRVGLR